ncbi:hypothetical protein CDAR_587491 [Caerostris darwini]|uniref:Uncharacterized protein n=1 Tax=Caerostris darwini TaxID=1538125 RepID=A0AAV4SI66_9ARAC|nr:hypothetical protein CDAR_587491 [Caerostris darwini]
MTWVLGLLSETIANRAALESQRITALVNFSRWHWTELCESQQFHHQTQYLVQQGRRKKKISEKNSGTGVMAIRQDGSIGKDSEPLWVGVKNV